MHVKKNDNVVILAGKDRGKIGKILRVILKKDRVVVEKLNMVKRHQRPNEKNRTGGIVEKEAPIHVSNVALYCEKCGKGVRTRAHYIEGRKVRACVQCDVVFD